MGERGADIRSDVTWSGRQLLIGFVGAALLIFALSTVIILPVSSEFGDESAELYAASAIATLLWNLSYVGLTYSLVQSSGAGWSNLGLRNFSFRPLLIVGGYAVAYGSVLAYGILVGLFGLDFLEPDSQLPEELFDSRVAVAVTGVAVMAGAPLAEEILFRGFLFGGLRRRWGLWPAAVVSGIIFAAAHTNLGLLVPFTMIGVILAYVYERSGTLITPIGVHLLFNSVSFSLVVLFPELRETSESGWIAPISLRL